MSSSPESVGRSSQRQTGTNDSRRSEHEHTDRSRRGDDALRHHRRRSRVRDLRNDRTRHDRDRGMDSRYRERPRSRSRSPYRHTSHSPSRKSRRELLSESKSPPPRRSRVALPSQDESFRGDVNHEPGNASQPPKQKPNYKPTGLLAKEANTVQGTTTVLKYHEPPEARKPSTKEQWRMYVFKKKDLLDTIHLYTKSAWLLGRDEKVTDLLLEHPSVSKQHAVIQFRHITSTDQYGDKLSRVKPYLIDLDSANGTSMNGKKIGASKFIELLDQDVIKFGDSDREYVMMLPSGDM